MNKAISIVTFVMLMAVFAVSATAQLTISDVQFGDENQERNQNVTKTITVTNTDTANSVTFSSLAFSSASGGADVSQFKLAVKSVTVDTTAYTGSINNPNANTFTFSTPITLAAGKSASVVVEALVPKKFSAVDTNLVAQALEMAKASLGGVTPTTVTVTGGKLTMQAKNKLVVDDMTITVNGESQSVSNNEKVDNLKPGDKLELEVLAKNQFSDRSDVDTAIDDAIVSVLSNNLDQIDVDEEEDLGTLSAKGDDSARFSFNIEDDTDDTTYVLTVKVTGTDENGAKHGEKVSIRLKVERETHEIAFKKVQVVPAAVECEGSRTAIVDVTVNNIGQRDEDAIVVEAIAPQLKFSQKITGLKLNDGKSKTLQFPIEVPEGKSGTVRVDLATYWDNTQKSNTKSVSFDVAECEEVEPSDIVQPTPTPTPQPPAITQPPVTTPATPAPKAKISAIESFTDSTLYVYLLAGLSGVLVLIIFVMLIALVSRRRRDDED